MSEANETRHLATVAQAVAIVKRAPTGTRFYVMVRNSAPIEGKADREFPNGLACSIRLSRADAARTAENMLSSTLEGRGARIPIVEYERAAFASMRAYVAIYLG